MLPMEEQRKYTEMRVTHFTRETAKGDLGPNLGNAQPIRAAECSPAFVTIFFLLNIVDIIDSRSSFNL